jgi:hypothetical protein
VQHDVPRPGATTRGRLAKTAMTKVEMMVMAAVAVIMLVFMSARHALYPCGAWVHLISAVLSCIKVVECMSWAMQVPHQQQLTDC